MDYRVPTDLDDALQLLATGNLTVVAGGTDYFPARPVHGAKDSILDVTRVSGLRGIWRQDDGGYRIGAATRWSDIVQADLPAAFDGLRAAAREVGSIQIQNAGTVAGNLCNASPAADGVPPLLTLDAAVEMASADGIRTLPLADFLTGVRKTALRPGEIVTAILVPAQPGTAVSAFEKLGNRRYLVISISMVAVLLDLDPQGIVRCARVAVGACSPVACRLPTLEADLVGHRPAEVQIAPAHLKPLAPIDDMRGTAAYRLDAVTSQIRNALKMAVTQDG